MYLRICFIDQYEHQQQTSTPKNQLTKKFDWNIYKKYFTKVIHIKWKCTYEFASSITNINTNNKHQQSAYKKI